jgi:hypothetical protein
MDNETNKNSLNNHNKAEEPETAFKTIRVFDSFEEMNEYDSKQRASLSHGECLQQVEELRKRVFHEHLLPNDRWPPISKTFKVVEPYVNRTG